MARKRSSDPKQEALREEKDQWNKAVSLLIAKLIAFKRGINGRGDEDVGLPKVKIKEPFPDQYALYLNNIAKDYSDIIHGAQGIMSHQRDYSTNRRKPNVIPGSLPLNANRQEELLKLASDEELVSHGYNLVSHIWDYLSLLGIDKVERKQRLYLIAAAHETIKKMHKLEYIISSKEDNKLVESAEVFHDLAWKFQTVFLNTLDELLLSTGLKQLPAPKTEEKVKKPKIRKKKEPEEVYSEEPPKRNIENEIATVFKQFHGEASDYFNKIKHSDLDPESIKAYQEWKDKLESQINKRQFENTKDWDHFKKEFGTFLKALRELTKKLNLKTESYLEEDLTKIAQNALSRWVRRKLLGINPSMQDQYLLKIIDKKLELETLLKRMIDNLQDRDGLSEVVRDADIVKRIFQDMLFKMEQLLDSERRQIGRSKIPDKLVAGIKKLRTELEKSLPELPKEKEVSLKELKEEHEKISSKNSNHQSFSK